MATDKQSKELEQTRHQLLCKVAWLYYHDDHTQAEIADKLGISRVTINRLIKEARETGVVEIKVHTDFSDVFELGQRLSNKFNLRDAIVTPLVEKDEELNSMIAQTAAEVLMQRLKEGLTIGVGIGRTISYIPDFFHPATPVPCRFIGLTGGLDFRHVGMQGQSDPVLRQAPDAFIDLSGRKLPGLPPQTAVRSITPPFGFQASQEGG